MRIPITMSHGTNHWHSLAHGGPLFDGAHLEGQLQIAADEEDGGPPHAARYITKDTNPFRLPSMDLEYLVYEHGAFRRYLEGALIEEKAPVEVT